MRRDRPRILVVDDEPRYIRIAQLNLEARGCQVLTAPDGPTAIALVAGERPDLVLLDIRMPGPDGFEVCRRIREFSAVPILFLTALAEEEDKVRGLDTGADDYVTKPFSVPELLARVQAVLRRAELAGTPDTPPVFVAGGLRVDCTARRVFVDGQEVRLTATEYRLLRELVQNAGRVVLPAYLLEEVWGEEYAGEERLVHQAVCRLRRRIEPDPRHPRYILTRRGLGYVCVRPD